MAQLKQLADVVYPYTLQRQEYYSAIEGKGGEANTNKSILKLFNNCLKQIFFEVNLIKN